MTLNGIYILSFLCDPMKCPHEHKQAKDKKTTNRETSISKTWAFQSRSLNTSMYLFKQCCCLLHMRNIKCQILTLNTFKGLIKRIITKSMKYAFDGVARYFIPNRLSFLTMIKSNCGNGPCQFLLKLREHP